jgi:hypothetical protein
MVKSEALTSIHTRVSFSPVRVLSPGGILYHHDRDELLAEITAALRPGYRSRTSISCYEKWGKKRHSIEVAECIPSRIVQEKQKIISNFVLPKLKTHDQNLEHDDSEYDESDTGVKQKVESSSFTDLNKHVVSEGFLDISRRKTQKRWSFDKTRVRPVKNNINNFVNQSLEQPMSAGLSFRGTSRVERLIFLPEDNGITPAIEPLNFDINKPKQEAETDAVELEESTDEESTELGHDQIATELVEIDEKQTSEYAPVNRFEELKKRFKTVCFAKDAWSADLINYSMYKSPLTTRIGSTQELEPKAPVQITPTVKTKKFRKTIKKVVKPLQPKNENQRSQLGQLKERSMKSALETDKIVYDNEIREFFKSLDIDVSTPEDEPRPAEQPAEQPAAAKLVRKFLKAGAGALHAGKVTQKKHDIMFSDFKSKAENNKLLKMAENKQSPSSSDDDNESIVSQSSEDSGLSLDDVLLTEEEKQLNKAVCEFEQTVTGFKVNLKQLQVDAKELTWLNKVDKKHELTYIQKSRRDRLEVSVNNMRINMNGWVVNTLLSCESGIKDFEKCVIPSTRDQKEFSDLILRYDESIRRMGQAIEELRAAMNLAADIVNTQGKELVSITTKNKVVIKRFHELVDLSMYLPRLVGLKAAWARMRQKVDDAKKGIRRIHMYDGTRKL